MLSSLDCTYSLGVLKAMNLLVLGRIVFGI